MINNATGISGADWAGYAGAGIMAVFAFQMNPVLAVIGLSLLTVQSVSLKAHNLTVLNLVSIGGFLSNIL
jgi:hypothetical protein